MRNRFAQIARYQPHESGFYRYTEEYDCGDGTTVISTHSATSDGMDLLVRAAELMEFWQPYLEILAPYLEPCGDHGLLCWDHEWELNDYSCDPLRDPTHIDFLFGGFHRETDRYCVCAWAHSVPSGLLVEIDR